MISIDPYTWKIYFEKPMVIKSIWNTINKFLFDECECGGHYEFDGYKNDRCNKCGKKK